jgi:thiol:disulfide interchange protein DsbD
LLNQTVEESRWQAYTPERLQQLRSEGRPVFINLTADWCLTCLANERVTLGTDEITEAYVQAVLDELYAIVDAAFVV